MQEIIMYRLSPTKNENTVQEIELLPCVGRCNEKSMLLYLTSCFVTAFTITDFSTEML